MKKTFLIGLGVLWVGCATAPAVIYSTNWSNALNPGSPFANGGIVPAANLSGWSDTRTVTAPAGTLQGVAVNLQLSGGWNGDLYAYLLHSSGSAVLLDRVGVGLVGAAGYGDAGMNVKFADAGAGFGVPLGDIHSYGGYAQFSATPSGLWAPDGTHAGLGTFVGANPGGQWSLFIADLSGGDVTTVQSWGLELNIVPVPEVETWVAAALAGLFGAYWLNRQIWTARR